MLRNIILLTATLAAAQACTWPGCHTNSSDFVCNGIQNIPTCLPTNITSLIVTNSPNLHIVTNLPGNITKLQMNSTGLTNLSPTAISNATNLESLYSIEGISNYVALQEITISSTNIQTINNAMLQGLHYVTILDISQNKRLYKIDENAFKDLVSLKSLNMNRCQLYTLYGSYFDNINGNRGYVTALANPYECLYLCDFMNWYWDHIEFDDIGVLGTCTIRTSESTVNIYQIYELEPYQAGCPPVIAIVIAVILGVFFLICLAACIAVVFCGVKYRKYCCCCCGSQRNRRVNQSRATSQDIHYICRPDNDQPQTQFPMYDDTPPTYEELAIPPEVNKATSTTAMTLENTSATSTS